MKNWKRILAALLVVCMAAALVACQPALPVQTDPPKATDGTQGKDDHTDPTEPEDLLPFAEGTVLLISTVY